MINQTLLTLITVFGGLATVILIAVLLFFSKTIFYFLRLKSFGKKGYYLAEHLGGNHIRTYYLVKPSEEHFVGKAYKISNKKILNSPMFRFEIPNIEDDNLIKKLVFKDSAVTLKWGVPTITYVGNNYEPFVFVEEVGLYGSQRTKLLYEAWENFVIDEELRKIMIICLIGTGVIGIILLLNFIGHGSAVQLSQSLCYNYNVTAQKLIDCAVNNFGVV